MKRIKKEIINSEALLNMLEDLEEEKKNLNIFMKGFDTSSNSMVLLKYEDKKAVIKRVNNAFCNLYGYKKKESVGKTPTILKSGTYEREYYAKLWNNVLNPKIGRWQDEIVNRRKDGKFVNVILTINTIFNEKNEAEYFIANHVDITERKQYEEKAQIYFNIAGTMIVVIDKKGKIEEINQKGLTILGYKRDEVIGKDWVNNFLPKRFRKKVSALSKQMLVGKVKVNGYFENPILNKKGEERLIAWNGKLIKDNLGKIIGHISSGEDITDQKKKVGELKEAKRKLERKLEEFKHDHSLIKKGRNKSKQNTKSTKNINQKSKNKKKR